MRASPLERTVAGLVLAPLPLACVALYAVDPATAGTLAVCPFRAATGLACPLCGSLRAVHQLLHGRPLAALALNALTVPALPALVVALAVTALAGRLPVPRARWPWQVAAVAAIAFTVVRNLPSSVLAP